MKKLLSLALFLISAAVFSQPISLPITWDVGGVDYTDAEFGGTTNGALVADPSDATNSVLSIQKPAGAQTWAGNTLGNPGVNNAGFPVHIPLTPGNTTMTIRIRSDRPAGTPMMAKIEHYTNGGIFVEKVVNTTVAAGQWENMVFDFNTGAPALVTDGITYGKISFFADFGNNATTTNFYIDNVAVGFPPTISSFTPTSETTGNTVSIFGNNFNGATAVSFGGSPAASFTVVSNTQIDAVVGVGFSGAVKVTTPVSFESLAGFTFLAPLTAPTITSFTPTSGATGATITITGTNFDVPNAVTAVNFGGDAAFSFTIVNSTTITAVVDLGNSGSVAVTNPDGVGTLAGFTYIPPAPTISSFTPTSSGGGVTVTITGTNFLDVSGVTFGGTAAASFTVVSPTSITAVLAAGASGSVAVTNSGGTGSLAGFVFRAPISLPIDYQSATVDYTATDFGGTLTAVATDPVNALNSCLRITKQNNAETWAGTTLGKDFNPKVNNGGLNVPIPFTVNDKIITARVYSSKPVGTIIMCKVEKTTNGGVNVEVQATTTVQNGWSTLFFNFASVNLGETYEKISFFPDFTVGGGGYVQSIFYLDDVAFYPSPTISSFTPTSATTGNVVTITGTNFTGATAVSFGGVAATSFTVVNATTITAVVANGASGSVSVTRGGTGSLAGFTFTAPPTGATVTSFTPTTAGETGVVTITGTNFDAPNVVSSVTFGGVAAASYTIVDDNTITAVLGAGASGAVSVTNQDAVGSLAGFSYIPKAAISLPITWDSPITIDYTTSDFGGPILTSSQDVDPLNALNKVLKVVKGTGAATWAGTTLGKPGVNNGGFLAPIPFTPSNRFMTAKVYSTRPIGTIVMMKIEQGTAPAQNSEKAVATTVQNAWETMVFDFGAQTGGNPLNYSGVDYDKVSMFFNFGNPGTASVNEFYLDDVRFVPGPLISNFTPTSAATGATVTINGDNFTGASAVSFGGVAATSFTVVNDNQITAVVGAGFSGNVVVTTIGTGSLAGFDWIAPLGAPTIASFTPTSSYVGGVITLSGSNFTAATAVKFGGTDAASYTVVNSSTITAIVGPGSTGNVTVSNGFGTGSKPGYTFIKKPISLPVTWDDFATVQLVSGDFGQVTSALATDPLDVSNTVTRLTKSAGGGGGSGTILGNAVLASPIPFSLGNTVISVRFYSPIVGLNVLLKLEGPAPIEKQLTTTMVGWQVMKFDFSASANFSDIYNRLVIFPGFNQVPGSAQVSYVDNIRFGEFPTNAWTGTTSTDFLKGSNWSLGFPPLDCSLDVQINGNTPFSAILASGSYNGGNVNIASNATLSISTGATYSLCGNLTGGPVSGSGTLAFSGSTAQTISGTHSVSNFTVTKPAASGSVTINGTVNLQGVMTLSNATSNVVVGGSGKLVLVSTASATGSIAAIPAGASVSGNVTQKRYLPGTGNGWFFLGTPIQGGDFSQWSDNMYMAVGSNLGGNQGVVGLGSQHTTIFKMDEPNASVYVDTVQRYGWRAPVLGDLLNPGQGFRVWLKAYNTPSRLIDNVGTVTQGNFTFPTLTRTEVANCQPSETASTIIPCTEAFRGWNLMANPYPSAIDWNSASWTKPAQMNNAFYIWNSTAGGYRAYNGTGAVDLGVTATTNVPANVIPSSQAFFVKVTTTIGLPATFSVQEGAKVASSGQFVRSAVVATDQVRIRLTRDAQADYQFDAMLKFDDAATYGFDQNLDMHTFPGSAFEFSLVGENGEALLLNSVPFVSQTKVIPVTTSYNGLQGNFTFSFIDAASITNGAQVYLKDKFLGTITSLALSSHYTFEVANGGSSNSDRFELIISPNGVTGVSQQVNGVSFGIYPNPSNGKQVTLSVSGKVHGAGQVVITDVLGKVVLRSDLKLADGLNEKALNLNLPSGVYNVQIRTALKTISEKLIVQ